MQLVYFSPVPWASYAQRPHKFVEWFHARRVLKVRWVDPTYALAGTIGFSAHKICCGECYKAINKGEYSRVANHPLSVFIAD